MASSDRGKFRISIIENDTSLEIIESKDKKYYVCAEEGQSFMLHIQQRKKTDEIFGSKLYLDGKEINGVKTFKSEGNYFGFKMGNGNYKRFLFDIPPMKDATRSNEEIRNENREFGTIKIEIFKTSKIMSKKKHKRATKYRAHCQSVREDGLKFFERTLSVKEGEQFSLEMKNFKKERTGYENGWGEDYVDDYIIDYDAMVDEITFYYTDFISLQIKGIV